MDQQNKVFPFLNISCDNAGCSYHWLTCHTNYLNKDWWMSAKEQYKRFDFLFFLLLCYFFSSESFRNEEYTLFIGRQFAFSGSETPSTCHSWLRESEVEKFISQSVAKHRPVWQTVFLSVLFSLSVNLSIHCFSSAHLKTHAH